MKTIEKVMHLLRSLGGGAILSQIHDFDYSIYLFGMPKCIYAIGGKLSELDIDVEDSVNILLHLIIRIQFCQ